MYIYLFIILIDTLEIHDTMQKDNWPQFPFGLSERMLRRRDDYGDAWHIALLKAAWHDSQRNADSC